MYVLIAALVIALVVFVVLAVIIIVLRFRPSRKSRSEEIHFLGGANIEDGRISSGKNYFRGMTDLSGETVIVDENRRSTSQSGIRITVKNQESGTAAEYSLDNSLVFGRSEGYGIITINDRYASGMHCELKRQGERLFLSDLNSSNHTFLNGKQIYKNAEVFSGDVIKLGNTKLKITF